MKILYFHQHFKTPQGTGGIRSYEMAKRLIESGHEVTMVCGSDVRAGKLLPDGPDRKVRRGRIDGIDVIEFVLPYSNYDSLLKRSQTFLRFSWRSIRLALREDYDLLFATSTPLTAGIPGVVMRFFRRKPFVFEVRDLWPELPREIGLIRNPFVLGAMSLLEWMTYRRANGCVGLSPGIVEGIRKRAPQGKPVEMVPNGCDLDLFRPGRREALDLPGIRPGDFVAMFVGAHGTANGLGAVLDAAGVLRKRGRDDIRLVFIGDGKEKASLVERAGNEGLDNCLFFDPIPKQRLSEILGRANAGLMILADVPAFYYGTSPNKFFDYIAAGLPVLNNYPGWLADLITRNRCGLAVPPGDPAAFANGLCEMADSPEAARDMGKRARALAEAEFGRDDLAERFCDFLESVACCGEGRTPAESTEPV